MPAPSGQESITAPAVTTDLTRQELPYRLRQQALLGEFGRLALQTRDIGQILQRATELCAQGLETPFAKVLEYLPDDKRLLIRAGVGWESEVVGQVLRPDRSKCSTRQSTSPSSCASRWNRTIWIPGLCRQMSRCGAH
jgi:GAF domain-containing protein